MQNHLISVAEISKELSQNSALVDMAPNFFSALKNILVFLALLVKQSGRFLHFAG